MCSAFPYLIFTLGLLLHVLTLAAAYCLHIVRQRKHYCADRGTGHQYSRCFGGELLIRNTVVAV